MKKTLRVWRWIIGAAIGLCTISFIAYQQHVATEQYKSHRANYCSAFSKTIDEKEACIEEKVSARDYLPWGYELFRWPEGVTTWAIIATAFFIAWQSWETRKAAQSASEQAKIQRETLRPRLNISNLSNNAYEEAALGKRVHINIKIANSGGMPAYGVIAETWIEFLERGPMERPWQFSSKAKYDKGATLNIDTAYPQGFEIPFNRCLTEAEIFQMREAKGTVCFRIRLIYLVFGEERHFDHAFAMTPTVGESIAEYISAN